MRQRPSTQAELPRRERGRGFSPGHVAETIALTDPVSVERSEPLHFSIQQGVADAKGEWRRRFAERPGDYLAEPLLVSRIPGALVDTSRFIICPGEDRYLLDSFRHPGALIRWGYTHVEGDIYEREAAETVEEREERVVVLGAQANRNYSHWLVESVIRVLLFRPFDDGSVRYLCPRLEDWQREALLLAGLPEERITTIPRRRLVRFPEVFAVSRGMSRIPALIPGALSVLAALAEPTSPRRRLFVSSPRRRLFVSSPRRRLFVSSPRRRLFVSSPRRRLFVSRAKVERRHVSNEAKLAEVLTAHGFETVHPEQLAVATQIELFANAEAVIGSWGSGLTNLIFSPPGTLVVELQPEGVDYGGNAFLWNLTSIRGQPFAQVVCPIAQGMRHLPLGERDMTVDVHEIDELLSRLLA